MKTLKTRGVVLKEYETGEADKRLLLLCKEHGRVMVYARGARKPRSKFLAAAQMFTYSDFILADGRGFFSVTQADVIENFYEIRTDYDRLCAAHLITDVCEKTLLEENNCDDLLLLVLKSLSHLAKGKFSARHVAAVFLMRFFDFYGLRPNVKFSEASPPNPHALFEKSAAKTLTWGREGICGEGEISAEGEVSGDIMEISHSVAAAASFILKNTLADSFKFEASASVLGELLKMSRLLWRNHFGRELKLEV